MRRNVCYTFGVMAKKPSVAKKSAKPLAKSRKRHAKPHVTATSGLPIGRVWFLVLTAFFVLAALPLIGYRLHEDIHLPTAYLAPLAIWFGTAALTFWFTRPKIFNGDRCFVTLTLLLFGLGILIQLRLGTFAITWRVWRAYAPMLLGVGGFLFCLRCLKARHLERLLAFPLLKWGMWCATMGVIGALFLFGRSYRGGMFLPGQINPTELIKLAMVLLGASLLPTLRERLTPTLIGIPTPRLSALLQLGFFWCIPLVGVVLVRDLGLVLILCLTYVAMLTALTRNAAWLLLSVGGAAAAGLAVCQLSAHTAVRFAIWQNPFSDPLGKGYQILQSLCAMNAGGLWGSGLNNGMPESVPIVTSDFVYAAIAEEWGLIGCALLMATYALWLHRIFNIGARAASLSVKLAAAGIGSVLAVQILLNIGGVTKALPMTGITLPFLSHGGFSLLTTLLLCGIVTSLSKQD